MNQPSSPASLPIIDIATLQTQGLSTALAQQPAAVQIRDACRRHGFFYVVGHKVDPALIQRLDDASRQFFALPPEQKMRWPMVQGGRAWRGYFPTGGELTSNRPDWKEGLYFGTELPDDDPRVIRHTPMHGANLFPDTPGLRAAVLDYMRAVTALGHRLVAGIALSLGLEADYFEKLYTADPLILFRVFNYPSSRAPEHLDVQWGVGEHTDYGLLTLLHQDNTGGLEVHTPAGWIPAPPVAGSFVCNIGDMLDFATGGLYKSTPHRVRKNTSGHGRLSFPLFFDPNFQAHVRRIPNLAGAEARDDSAQRWDHTNIHAFDGTYGEYLLGKVGKVFPQLRDAALTGQEGRQ